jgi:hypothetical protein
MASLINAAPSLFEPPAGSDQAPTRASLLNGSTPLASPPTQADAFDATSKAYGDWVAKERADGVAKGLIDPQTGWPTKAGLEDASRQLAQSVLLGTSAPEFKGPALIAFHGSPHSFDTFDASKIGTGEGAQAYGHGLYFADNEAVARGYRDALTRGQGVAGSAATMDYAPGVLASLQKNSPGLISDAERAFDLGARNLPQDASPEDLGNAAIAHLQNWQSGYLSDAANIKGPNADAYRAKAAEYDTLIKHIQDGDVTGAQTGAGGRMYQVQVNADPAHFLDWDKPLSEQTPHVQQALTGANIAPVRPVDGGYVVDFNSDGQQKTSRVFPTAEAAQNAASPLTAPVRDWATAHAGAKGGDYRVSAEQSQALNAAGIPGIRYLDGGSRADGQGTSNHVIFDPATIAILRKYGIVGLMAGGAATQAPSQ